MKNKILSFLMPALAAASLISCEDKTAGLTGVTYYPVFTVLGEPETVVYVGETYVDAGCEATLNGEDITADIKVSQNVDTSTPGVYSVVYSATNELGFTSSSSRTVYVAREKSFDNLYFGTIDMMGKHFSGAPIFVTDLGDGGYMIDDGLAGYYFYGRYPGYEPTYDFHAEVYVTLDGNSIVQYGDTGAWYFGDPVEIESGEYDPATGIISYSGKFVGYDFSVVLNPVTK
ncbi:MAG: immunoglobulin-like domain-containing protein [Candidatus Cryptobacteroides sp.]